MSSTEEDIFLFYRMPGLRLEGESQCMLFDPVGVTGILPVTIGRNFCLLPIANAIARSAIPIRCRCCLM
ncbi:hypothetical protein BJP36_40795 [Moorena producens JHB]|uniref:Uncharacterized protein n=1 Tax=Moorena producens (strain JHB) TaxID=1454205 RepID=A0A9Q9UVD1_MOOP1|nr:hypothetical protein [Moorena producens]WAN68704.1 hypothetical protein BJP36_40795 [Moorena producens JHB]